MKNRLTNTVMNFIQKNSNQYEKNELFSILSLLSLVQITDIYQKNTTSVISNEDSLNSNSDSESPLSNLSSFGDISSLLGQIKGNGKGNNLQQMLPILMGALGGNNNNLDMSKLTNLLQNLNQNQKTQTDDNTDNNHNEDTNNSKKKVIGK
ncbi:MAG: hypothetical protein ACOCZT_01015 [Halanaerobiales bacterium]